MPIVRTAFSHASTWGGNKPREMLRSHGGEEGWHPSDDERVSPNQVNSLSASLRYYWSVSLSEMVKPAMVGNETFVDTYQASRGSWRERALKEQQNVRGDPFLGPHSMGSGLGKGCRESITCSLRKWKSEQFVVAKKRGNACGAKGLYFSHVSIKIRRSA